MTPPAQRFVTPRPAVRTQADRMPEKSAKHGVRPAACRAGEDGVSCPAGHAGNSSGAMFAPTRAGWPYLTWSTCLCHTIVIPLSCVTCFNYVELLPSHSFLLQCKCSFALNYKQNFSTKDAISVPCRRLGGRKCLQCRVVTLPPRTALVPPPPNSPFLVARVLC